MNDSPSSNCLIKTPAYWQLPAPAKHCYPVTYTSTSTNIPATDPKYVQFLSKLAKGAVDMKFLPDVCD